MYSLFTNPLIHHGGLIPDTGLVNFRKRTVEDIDRVIEYYRYGTFFTRSDHLIAKLINTVATPLSYDLDRYYEVTLARSLYTANSLQLTSSINRGRIFSGVFYYGCPEIIIAYNEAKNPNDLIRDWRNLRPVTLLQSPVSNLRYLVPNAINQQVERGLVVVGVDIGMLMVMYRSFMMSEYQKQREDPNKPLLSTHHFVGKYVLPNMLYSQTDLAIFNRMYNLLMGAPMGHAYKRHPIYISDYTDKLDRTLEDFIKRLSNNKREYENYLANIPSVFSEFPLSMPDIVETRQVYWALFLARMKAIEFLFELGGREGMDFNRHHIGKLKIELKQFNSDRVFNRILPDDMLMEVNYQLEQWKAL